MRIVYLVIWFLLIQQEVNAQYSLRPNLYLQDMMYYNPASIMTDSTSTMQTTIYGKLKSVDRDRAIWDKPMNMWISHVNRLNQSNTFLTVAYLHDTYSYFTRNALYGGIMRESKLGKQAKIVWSGRIVMNVDKVDWEEFVLPSSTSKGTAMKFNPDIDLGVTYHRRRIVTGVGIRNILATTSEIDNVTLLRNRREINYHFRYNQPIGQHITLAPFLLLSREIGTTLDIGLSLCVLKTVRGSYAFRANQLTSVYNLESKVGKHFALGIAYDRSPLLAGNTIEWLVRYRR